MACAKCDFYVPKKSSAALLLEGKTQLLRLLQEIPLGESEQAAVEDGVAAYESLLSKLADVPTPAGPTPRQIGAELVQITAVRSQLPASMTSSSGLGCSQAATSLAKPTRTSRRQADQQMTRDARGAILPIAQTRTKPPMTARTDEGHKG